MMRIMNLAEIAESRGMTLIELAALRTQWIELAGEVPFPMTVTEIEWQIDQYNAASTKVTDQKRTIARAVEFIDRHTRPTHEELALSLTWDQISALQRILRGV